jgi:carbamoyl-phosphate synthase large subunit
MMKSGDVQLVFNTTEGSKAIADSYDIRRTALVNGIPYSTTLAGCGAVVRAIQAMAAGQLDVAPLQSYFEGSF